MAPFDCVDAACDGVVDPSEAGKKFTVPVDRVGCFNRMEEIAACKKCGKLHWTRNGDEVRVLDNEPAYMIRNTPGETARLAFKNAHGVLEMTNTYLS